MRIPVLVTFVLIGFWALEPDSVLVAQDSARSSSLSVEVLVGRPLSETDVQVFLKGIGASAPEHGPSPDGGYYRTYKSTGISLLCNRDSCIVTVFLYARGQEGYAQFRHALPNGLSFEDGRAAATQKLGLPACAGGGEQGILGRVEIWDKWRTNWGALHISYKPDGKIALVTLMTPSSDPGCRDAR